MPVRLVSVDDGPDIVLDRAMVVVGRHRSCDTRLSSLRVSRQHCCVTQENGEVLVRDLGSANGIRINGQRVQQGRLRHGDELTIAHIRFRFENGQGHEQTVRSNSSSPRGERGAEVFPWMEHAIVAGAALGVVVAFGLGCAFHLGLSGIALGGAFGAVAGAMGGICLALRWAVEMPAHATVSGDLYDPWLDGRHSVGVDAETSPPPVADAAALPAEEISHRRALVRPRVLSNVTGESLPLAEMVGPLLEGRESGMIRVVGGPGSGKTTALDYLAGIVPPHLSVFFLDEPLPTAIREAFPYGWVVYTSKNGSAQGATNLPLAGWGEDEWIEYLLASDRQLCASVMARLARAKVESARLEGIPELWRHVLDRMMADPSVQGPCSALRNELAGLLPDAVARQPVLAKCFYAFGIKNGDPVHRLDSAVRHDLEPGLFRLIRHRPVALLLAADFVAGAINHEAETEALASTLHRDLVLETAARIADDPAAVDRLRSLIDDGDGRLHPMVASLLHALRVGWKPAWPSPRLADAYLDNASWPDINLAGADMRGADLGGANVSGSRLDRANLAGADLVDTNLCGSSMEEAIFDKADLSRASLSQVRAKGARFEAARLVAANLVAADFHRAILTGANLTDAQLADASLVGADLRSTKLDGADFSRADLRGAIDARGESDPGAVHRCVLHRCESLALRPRGHVATRRRVRGCRSLARAFDRLENAWFEFPQRSPAGSRPGRDRLGGSRLAGSRLARGRLSPGIIPQRTGRQPDCVRGKPHRLLHRRL